MKEFSINQPATTGGWLSRWTKPERSALRPKPTSPKAADSAEWREGWGSSSANQAHSALALAVIATAIAVGMEQTEGEVLVFRVLAAIVATLLTIGGLIGIYSLARSAADAKAAGHSVGAPHEKFSIGYGVACALKGGAGVIVLWWLIVVVLQPLGQQEGFFAKAGLFVIAACIGLPGLLWTTMWLCSVVPVGLYSTSVLVAGPAARRAQRQVDVPPQEEQPQTWRTEPVVRRERTRSAPAAKPAAAKSSLGRRQRDFIKLCDPQTGTHQNAVARQFAYAEIEQYLQEPMDDKRFDRLARRALHSDNAPHSRLTRDELHELFTEFVAMA